MRRRASGSVSSFLSSIDECGMTMAVPPLVNAGQGEPIQSKLRRSAVASGLTSDSFAGVNQCSWRATANIGLFRCSRTIACSALARPPFIRPPPRFLEQKRGPGWGSIPSSFKSRIHIAPFANWFRAAKQHCCHAGVAAEWGSLRWRWCLGE